MFSRFFAFAVAALLTTAAVAETYPARPVRLIVTFAAGGGADFVGRTVGQRLSEELGQPVVVDNRAGANGAVGAEAAARAAPDGYTVLLGAAGTMVVAPHLDMKLPFDPMRDFIPVSLVATSPFIVTVHPSVPAASVSELVAYAKGNPGKLNFGSSGNGGAPHLATELFASMAGIRMVHVPYRGLGPAVADLLGGQIQVLFADVPLVRAHAQAGSVKALAITSRQRSNVVPDLPPVTEAGVPGYSAGTWYGILVPVGTPEPVVSRLSAGLQKILASAELRTALAAQGAEAAPTTPQQFGEFMRGESAKWGKLIKDAGLKAD